ncbi:major facilitator superfamily domain-containing protein [Scleroderma yunnanense]
MDRSNVAAAQLKGLEEDLHMTGQQFNTLISIMYVGYVLMQVPSNVSLDQLRRPSTYLSLCAFSWGVFSISTGHYRGALISRFLLGFSEAVFYPGVLFMLSKWYKRDELGLRMAYFTCGASVSKVFGSLAASGILATMDGKLGFAAWRWLFFIEGGLTCAIAVVALYIIPDFPTTPASWLTVEEQMLAQQRMVEDMCRTQPDLLKGIQRSGLMEALTDWTVWWLAISMVVLNASLSFGIYFPTLVATMGYSPTTTLLLCAPPWVLGVATSFIVMQHSDATGDRFWHISGALLMGMVGFIIAIMTMNTAIHYLSLFLMAQSTVSYIVLLAWVSNSISESSSKRAVAIGFILLGVFVGSVVFQVILDLPFRIHGMHSHAVGISIVPRAAE